MSEVVGPIEMVKAFEESMKLITLNCIYFCHKEVYCMDRKIFKRIKIDTFSRFRCTYKRLR